MSDYDYDDSGMHTFFYLLTAFFALGIYLVISRYHAIYNRAIPFRYRIPEQVTPGWNSIKIPNPTLESHLIHAELAPPRIVPDRRYITCFDPATGYHMETLLTDSAVEIHDKIGIAIEAQKTWRQTSFRERRRFIRSLQKWLVDNQEVCAKVACRDTGKTLLDAALGEVMTTCSKAEWLINHGEQALRPQSRSTNLMLSFKKSWVQYEPLGVVAAIVSWNYPLHNSWSPILASLFAGNAIVLKCSEHVFWSTTWFVGAIKECLRVSGHNPELVQLVCCFPDQVEALTRSPHIRHITFIGSETVGRHVAIAAAEHLTPVTLELGGKDPAIIMPSTDLTKCISILIRGLFGNAGQNCIGIERVLVHSSQYQELYHEIVKRTSELRLGCAMPLPGESSIPVYDVGAMISKDRFEDIVRVLDNSVIGGAQLEQGGAPYPHPYLEAGSYFAPTVVGNADPNSELMQREMFAPIAALTSYEDLDEAVTIANGTRYGLGASVFGPDQEQCIKLASRLECGMVSINDMGTFYLNQDLPFGGTKYSGYGRFGGPEGLRALCNTKAIIADRFGWLVQTSIPKPIDYPVRSAVQSWRFITGLIGFLYGDGWRFRLQSLLHVVRAAGLIN